MRQQIIYKSLVNRLTGIVLSRPVVAGLLLYWVAGLGQYANFGMPQTWLDQAVSKTFSQTYHQGVRVAGIRIIPETRTIRFDSMQILSPGGPEWISCGGGDLAVRTLSVKPEFKMEFDLSLKSVALHKELYKRMQSSNPFGFLMHKPLQISRMSVRGTLGPHYTLFEIDDCRSKDIGLRGALRLEKNALVNRLHFSFTTAMFIRALF